MANERRAMGSTLNRSSSTVTSLLSRGADLPSIRVANLQINRPCYPHHEHDYLASSQDGVSRLPSASTAPTIPSPRTIPIRRSHTKPFPRRIERPRIRTVTGINLCKRLQRKEKPSVSCRRRIARAFGPGVRCRGRRLWLDRDLNR